MNLLSTFLTSNNVITTTTMAMMMIEVKDLTINSKLYTRTDIINGLKYGMGYTGMTTKQPVVLLACSILNHTSLNFLAEKKKTFLRSILFLYAYTRIYILILMYCLLSDNDYG